MDNKIIEENTAHLPNDPEPEGDSDIASHNLDICLSNADADNDHELSTIRNKRLELDSIQKDLNNLMCRLNSFIVDALEECEGEEDSNGDNNSPSDDADDDTPNVTEKQDGPPEKELKMKLSNCDDLDLNEIYTTDGTDPPEINWDNVGPILQKHVNDLQRLHNLNQMANAVLKRIKNVTQLNQAMQKEISRNENGSS